MPALEARRVLPVRPAPLALCFVYERVRLSPMEFVPSLPSERVSIRLIFGQKDRERGELGMRGELYERAAETKSVIAQYELAPAEYTDPVIEAYKKDVDRTLLRENLKLTVEERFVKFEQFWKYVQELREAGRKSRQTD